MTEALWEVWKKLLYGCSVATANMSLFREAVKSVGGIIALQKQPKRPSIIIRSRPRIRERKTKEPEKKNNSHIPLKTE